MKKKKDISGVQKDIENNDFVKHANAGEEEVLLDYEVFFNISKEILIVTNPDGNIIGINPEGLKLLQYTREEVNGQSFLKFLLPDDIRKMEELLKIYVSGKDTNSIVVKCLTAQGIKKKLKLDVKFIKNKFFICACDITESVELEEQLYQMREKFQLLFDHIPHRIYWKDTDLKYLGCNKAFAQVAEIKNPVEIIGKTDYDLPWSNRAGEYALQDFNVIKDDKPILDLEEHLIINGKNVYLKKSKVPLHDRENNVIGIICSYENITDKKYEENALKESEHRFRALFENSIDPIALATSEGIHIFVNQSFVKLFGYDDTTELVGKSILQYIEADSRRFMKENIKKRARNEDVLNSYEAIGIRKDNTKFLMSVHASIIELDGVKQTLIILRDITERRELLNKVRQSEIKYRTIANNTHDWEFWTSVTDDYNYISPSCQRITGYAPEDFLSNHNLINEIIHPDDKERYKAHVRNEKENKLTDEIQFKIIDSNGTVKWIDHVCMPVFDDDRNFMGTRGSNRDISERKQFEEKLRESEKTLKALFNAITEFAVLINQDGIVKTANKTAAELYNKTVDEFIGTKIFNIVNQELVENSLEYFKEAAENKKPVRFETSYSGLIKDMTIYPIFDNDNNVTQFVIFGVDITQKRDALNALSERDSMLTGLINATTESAFLIDTTGKILFANDTVAKRFGTTVDIFIGQSLFDLTNSEVALERKRHADYVIKTGKPIRFEDKRGDLIVDNSMYPIFNNEGKVIQLAVFGSDITKRKQAEEEITRINKQLLDSNSTKDKFFSIIAHDLRSPFQGLLGYSHILYEEYEDLNEEERKYYIQNIGEISKNAFKLLENLLQWSRMQTGNFEFNPEVFSISEELKPTVDLLSQTALNKNISVISMLKPKTYVMADKNMLNTVVRNLISNSIKFTNPLGVITISSSELNNFVVITIKDNGVGMTADKIKYLFKLEKNTSTVGTANEKGTGLGLLLCKEMIEKHNGEIWVESEPDKGSTFYFTLPKRI